MLPNLEVRARISEHAELVQACDVEGSDDRIRECSAT